jgi:hypothetical protein
MVGFQTSKTAHDRAPVQVGLDGQFGERGEALTRVVVDVPRDGEQDQQIGGRDRLVALLRRHGPEDPLDRLVTHGSSPPARVMDVPLPLAARPTGPVG